jgi:hypothetical protein
MHPIRLVCAGLLAVSAMAAPAHPSLPLVFVANHGQAHREARYMAKTRRFNAYFAHREAILAMRGASLRIGFLDAPGPRELEPESAGSGVANFLIGGEEEWATGVPLLDGVAYRDVYPGIDAVYRGSGPNLKSEYVVQPGHDPARIRLRYAGAERLEIEADGALLIRVGRHLLRESTPVIYQQRNGVRVTVEGAFQVNGDIVSFAVGGYDRTLPLTIDPVIYYLTLFGGSGTDAATSMAIDASGSAYIAGFTSSYDLPTASPEQNFSGGGNEVFVAKLTPSGNGIAYCTYIGGRSDDRAFGIAVDSAGAAYVAGSTTSSNFPVRGALQAKLAGGKNAFVLKLAAAGNALVYSTYLGGSGSDAASGIAVDAAGSAYLAGDTTSLNFPAAAFQKTNRGIPDAFVAKLAPDGSRLVYSTYLGGSGEDHATAIAIDGSGSAFVTGSTYSTNFPLASAHQAALAGGQDAFVTRLSADGKSLIFSTYLGGSNGMLGAPEAGNGIAVDGSGNVYVTGETSSVNFPIRGAVQSTNAGWQDAFVSKFGGSGGLVYSTYIGGVNVDIARAIAVDRSGYAHIAGETTSANLASILMLQGAPTGVFDAFIVKLAATGDAVSGLSYLGGIGADNATAIAVDASSNVYVAGWTQSPNFAAVNGFQTINGGNYSAFVGKMNFTGGSGSVGVTPGTAALYAAQTQQFTATVANSGNTAVTWSVTGAGSVSATGLYTAPASVTGQQTVSVRATSVADPSKSAAAVVTLLPAVAVTVAPGAVSLYGSQTQQFTATAANAVNTAVTWSVTGAGSVSATGLYTAPATVTSQQTVSVKATSVADTTKSATAAITLYPPVGVTVTPSTASLSASQTQQFTATVTNPSNTAVTWSVSPMGVGSISSTGLYTAPSTLTAQQTVTVTATSVADTGKSATAAITLSAAVGVTVAPSNASLYASQTRQFTTTLVNAANTAVTWSITPGGVGSVSSAGLYTAPANVTAQQTVVLKVTSVADTSKSATATVTLYPSIQVTVTPTATSLYASQTQQFTATLVNSSNTAVTWSITPSGVGSLSQVGLYTAPSGVIAQQNLTVTAASVVDPSKSASAVITLSPPAGPVNLAYGKSASQSSTFSSADASRAVDGVTDGDYSHGAVTHTNADAGAWWEVDLGSPAAIVSIAIWNRTDCCAERLNDYWVFVSDTPFAAADTPTTLKNRMWAVHQTGSPNPSSSITVGAKGRYVRVQLSGANYLNLAEVQVIGVFIGANLAAGKTATQSSTIAAASNAIDGIVDGDYSHGSVSHTNGDANAWWQVDLGASSFIAAVSVWNRTDCCSDRLSDYWIFVSDTPYASTDTPVTLQSRADTWSSRQTSIPQPSASVAPLRQGRYVRVQLSGASFLHLGEVQVFGAAGAAAAISVTMSPTTAILSTGQTQQFTATVSNASNNAVTWSLNPNVGSITFNGLYTAPSAIAAQQTVTVTATSAADPTKTAAASVTLRSADVVTNLALGKSAAQSSTVGVAVAAAAVDGNTDGNYYNGSVMHTNADNSPWWQVDLGASAAINSVTVWNRTDCCSSRLIDFWVFISDTPFGTADTPLTLLTRAATWASHQTGIPYSSRSITAAARGRYVRVQLSNTDFLHLAEVEVFGVWLTDNIAIGKAATQSSTVASANASNAIDGNVDGVFGNGSVTHTGDIAANAWWQVDLGASASIAAMTIWNRTDCCEDRLSDYWVFVSDTPFAPGDTPSTLATRAGTWSVRLLSIPKPAAAISVGARGRYVRIQLTGTNFLHLAEVEVFGGFW